MLAFSAGTSFIYAQNSTNTSGETAQGQTGTISYSIGEAFYQIAEGSNGSLLPGVQQPYQITEVLGSEISEINLSLSIYPNPVADNLTLMVGFGDYSKFSYELFDTAGQIISKKRISSKSTSIPMTSYPAANYLLKVIKDGKPVKVFKVLKRDK